MRTASPNEEAEYMLAARSPEVKSQGYVAGSLERTIRQWAESIWPDVRSDWISHRDYYVAEFVKSIRFEQQRAGR